MNPPFKRSRYSLVATKHNKKPFLFENPTSPPGIVHSHGPYSILLCPLSDSIKVTTLVSSVKPHIAMRFAMLSNVQPLKNGAEVAPTHYSVPQSLNAQICSAEDDMVWSAKSRQGTIVVALVLAMRVVLSE